MLWYCENNSCYYCINIYSLYFLFEWKKNVDFRRLNCRIQFYFFQRNVFYIIILYIFKLNREYYLFALKIMKIKWFFSFFLFILHIFVALYLKYRLMKQDFIITYILFLLHIVTEYKLNAYRVNKEQWKHIINVHTKVFLYSKYNWRF